VVNAKVVGSPVDEGVGLCQPGFAEKEIVVFERVDEWVEGGGVLLSFESDVSSVGRKGARAVWKDDGDGRRRRVKRNCVSLYKRGADHVTLSSAVNEDARRMAVDVTDKSEEGGLGLFDSEG
jgi:hypothetical protein